MPGAGLQLEVVRAATRSGGGRLALLITPGAGTLQHHARCAHGLVGDLCHVLASALAADQGSGDYRAGD